MSFLLDSDICSTYLRRPGALFHRFMQHAGRLWISTFTLSDLYTWAYKQEDPTVISDKIRDFRRDIALLSFGCAASVAGTENASRFPCEWPKMEDDVHFPKPSSCPPFFCQ